MTSHYKKINQTIYDHAVDPCTKLNSGGNSNKQVAMNEQSIMTACIQCRKWSQIETRLRADLTTTTNEDKRHDIQRKLDRIEKRSCECTIQIKIKKTKNTKTVTKRRTHGACKWKPTRQVEQKQPNFEELIPGLNLPSAVPSNKAHIPIGRIPHAKQTKVFHISKMCTKTKSKYHQNPLESKTGLNEMIMAEYQHSNPAGWTVQGPSRGDLNMRLSRARRHKGVVELDKVAKPHSPDFMDEDDRAHYLAQVKLDADSRAINCQNGKPQFSKRLECGRMYAPAQTSSKSISLIQFYKPINTKAGTCNNSVLMSLNASESPKSPEIEIQVVESPIQSQRTWKYTTPSKRELDGEQFPALGYQAPRKTRKTTKISHLSSEKRASLVKELEMAMNATKSKSYIQAQTEAEKESSRLSQLATDKRQEERVGLVAGSLQARRDGFTKTEQPTQKRMCRKLKIRRDGLVVNICRNKQCKFAHLHKPTRLQDICLADTTLNPTGYMCKFGHGCGANIRKYGVTTWRDQEFWQSQRCKEHAHSHQDCVDMADQYLDQWKLDIIKPRKPSLPRSGYKCKCCGQKGGVDGAHWVRDCPKKSIRRGPGHGYKCNKCGQKGGVAGAHWIQNCPKL